MKKAIMLSIAFAILITLPSCEVHWGNTSYDVHWWVIAIPVIIFSLLIFYIVGKSVSAKKYVCPKCGKTFRAKWWQAAFSIHIDENRIFKCPHCNSTEFCNISYKQD